MPNNYAHNPQKKKKKKNEEIKKKKEKDWERNEKGAVVSRSENWKPGVRYLSIESILEKGVSSSQQQQPPGSHVCVYSWNVHRTRRVCVRRGGASRRSVPRRQRLPAGFVHGTASRRYIVARSERGRLDQRGLLPRMEGVAMVHGAAQMMDASFRGM